MPSLLTRSKSLRLLTGSRRVHREEPSNSIPRSDASQTDFDRFKAATPVPRTQRTLEAPEMPTRPSTSGGPGERPVQFHKRTLPAPSVESEDRFLAFSSPTDSSAILHIPQQPQEQDVIGIALGSPTAASHWTSTPQATSDNLTSNAQMDRHYGNVSSVTLGSTQEPMKPKISRWKSFFKKAGSPLGMSQPSQREKQPFYQLVQQVAPHRADSHHDTSPVSETTPKQDGGGSSISPTAYDPEIRGSRKTSNAGAQSESRSDVQARQRAATVGLDRVHPRYNIKRSSTTPLHPSQPSVPGLLDIDIPDVQMERYSVMFSGVLEPGNRSSLLERRQPNAEKVKPLNQLTVKSEEKDGNKLQRRATSPVVSNPPSARLSLFPSPQIGHGPSTPTIRSRAKTAPAKSPVSQTFTPSEVTKPSTPKRILRKDSAHPYMKPERSESGELTPPSSKSSKSGEGSPVRVLARTESMHKEACRALVEAQEPDWELLPKPSRQSVAPREASPPPPRNPKRRESQRQPRVNVASALSSHPSGTSLRSSSPPQEANLVVEPSSPLENIEILLSPPTSAARVEKVQQVNIQRKNSERKPRVQTATVGIARSVSVSKANRPRTLNRRGTDVGSPERLVEHSALTPTLVEIGNRKSHRVQLVEA